MERLPIIAVRVVCMVIGAGPLPDVPLRSVGRAGVHLNQHLLLGISGDYMIPRRSSPNTSEGTERKRIGLGMIMAAPEGKVIHDKV